MTKSEIIAERNVELMVAAEGKSYNTLAGKRIKHNVTAVMWYDENSYLAMPQRVSLDSLFFSAVKKGYFTIPDDYDTCSRCGGSGNTGHNFDGGTCFKCHGFGYLKLK